MMENPVIFWKFAINTFYYGNLNVLPTHILYFFKIAYWIIAFKFSQNKKKTISQIPDE